VKIVARQPVRCPERGDAFAQGALLALQTLGFGFAGAKLD
jgi:hypothetical protein